MCIRDRLYADGRGSSADGSPPSCEAPPLRTSPETDTEGLQESEILLQCRDQHLFQEAAEEYQRGEQMVRDSEDFLRHSERTLQDNDELLQRSRAARGERQEEVPAKSPPVSVWKAPPIR
eukprot:5545868-Alexandrium_andersonii.AAC.1